MALAHTISSLCPPFLKKTILLFFAYIAYSDSGQFFHRLFRFDVKIASAVAEETSLPFVTAENKFEALVSF